LSMRILFCTPAPLMKSLGAAKVVVELAEEMQELGWDCDLVSIRDLADQRRLSMSESLRHHLLEHAANYDVVDYDHEYLPYPRSEFSPQPLFVARSVLLVHHLETIRIPEPTGIKAVAGKFLHGRTRQLKRQAMIQNAQATVQEAELINVSNEDDKAELMRKGTAAKKIVVIPFGISQSRRPLFDKVSSVPPEQPMVGFVGTFDYRKGAREFPAILQGIVKAVPRVRFRLLGTAGMFQTDTEVLAHFSPILRHKIEVMPRYHPEELPKLLSTCSVGIFPSHLEGFGFGILEMLAASVPVIAYNAPGPPVMLPAEYLVPRGDTGAMIAKTAVLLRDATALGAARRWAKQRSQQFCWEDAANTTADVYLEHWQRKQRDQDGMER